MIRFSLFIVQHTDNTFEMQFTSATM